MLQNDDVKGGFKGRTQTKSPDLEGAACWVPLMHLPYKIDNRTSASSQVFAQRRTAASVLYYILLSVILAAGMGDICERMLFTEEAHVRRVNKCVLCSWDFKSKCTFVQHCSLTHSILEAKTFSFFFLNQWIVVFYLFNSQSPYR